MDDGFERKVRGAAMAGWWTLLVGLAVLFAQWVAYLFMARTRPAWATFLLGPDTSWDHVLNLWWLATAVFKGLLALLAFVSLWLTLWARQLRKTGGA